MDLISFYKMMTHQVGEGKAVDVVYLDVSKAFDAISHSILLETLAARGLGGCALCWVKGRLSPERGGEWSYIQLATGHQWCSPGLSTGASSV